MEKFLIFAVVTGGAHAFLPVADTECNATETATLPCLATPGGSVFIQVMRNASGFKLWCKKETPDGLIKVFSVKRDEVTWWHEESRNRTEFFTHNGTLKIASVKKEDSGQYRVEVITSDGIHLKYINFELLVKENHNLILVIGLPVLGATVLLLICYCFYRAVKNCKKSGEPI